MNQAKDEKNEAQAFVLGPFIQTSLPSWSIETVPQPFRNPLTKPSHDSYQNDPVADYQQLVTRIPR